MRITNVKTTPIAIPDIALANRKDVHASILLRALIEVEADTGLAGLVEASCVARTLAGLRAVMPTQEGLDS